MFLFNYGNPLSVAETRKGKIVPEVVNDYNYNMNGVDKGDRYVNMHMLSFKNRFWKFIALLGIFYITISNISLFKNDLLDEAVNLKGILENLAYFLCSTPKNSKILQNSSSKSRVVSTFESIGECFYEKCSKIDKRTYKFCSRCKKIFSSGLLCLYSWYGIKIKKNSTRIIPLKLIWFLWILYH